MSSCCNFSRVLFNQSPVKEIIMNRTLIPGDEKEKRKHINAIHNISLDTGIPEENVTSLYEEILERYWSDARIKDYLSILVSREVKDILSSNQS